MSLAVSPLNKLGASKKRGNKLCAKSLQGGRRGNGSEQARSAVARRAANAVGLETQESLKAFTGKLFN
ncbi:hypothetical protein [Magnetofaba australis]|uniref:hypothetical protein n=1 Tax=Magnetofaba australis TaxID=1472297 RepID=UPI00117D1C9E|nr:hypothetical protein [Magnetofaba australis]